MAYDVSGQIAEGNTTAAAAEQAAKGYLQTASSTQRYPVTAADAPNIPVAEILPPVLSPTALDIALLDSNTQANRDAIVQWVDGQVDTWLAKYFPPLDIQLSSGEDAWLLDVMNNGYIGVPDAVANMIWNRARDNELSEALRLSDEAASFFADRGFSMPPGVLGDRALIAQLNAANKLSTIARDQAVKTMEISIDMAKFAITEITKLRTALADVMGKFLMDAMKVPMESLNMEIQKHDIKNKIWAASNDYMRAVLDIEKLAVAATSTEEQLRVSLINTDTHETTSRDATVADTAVRSAIAMAQIASSARSANNTLVGAVETISTKA